MTGPWYRQGAVIAVLTALLAFASHLCGFNFFSGLFAGLACCVIMMIIVARKAA